MEKIAFRVDCTDIRRLSRCISLAQAILEEEPSCKAVFLSSPAKIGEEMLRSAGMEIVHTQGFGAWELEATMEELDKAPADMVVVDLAHADEAYLSKLHERACVAVFDGLASLKGYDCDAVINPRVDAHMVGYPEKCGAELLLGTDFAILPASLDEYQEEERGSPERAKKVLICFGDDHRGMTIPAVRSLRSMPEGFTAMVANGPGFSKGEALAAEIGLDPRFMTVQDPEPSRRFHWADISISDPTYLPEILFFAMPSILLSSSEDAEAAYAARSGMAQSMPGYPPDARSIARAASAMMSDREMRSRMSGRMAELVDGLGRYRLASELLRILRERRRV